MISVLVDGTERKDYIDWKSFTKIDIITSQVDSLSFKISRYGTRTWKPIIGDSVVVSDGATKMFGGEVVNIEESTEGKVLTCKVMCKDYTHQLDKKLVYDTFEDEAVEDIVSSIITTYCPSFTTTNVAVTGIELKYILFNYQQPSKCLEELAELIGYDWYVDYDKDIHFFSKATGETTAFDLTDDSGNYVFDSLTFSENDTQLRNAVYVRGGEYVGDSRGDKVGVGDGTTKSFKLPYRYNEEPTVTVGGSGKTVGIDFIDSEDDYDCLWNYNEKIVKFKTAPVSGDVVATGKPLIPVLIKTKSSASINAYGEYEHVIVDKTILTKESARQRAEAEFDDYALPIKSASFITIKTGLKSGQKINVQSAVRTLNQDYIITRIVTVMRTPVDKFTYRVELSTGRPLGIINFLQKQIESTNKKIGVFRQEGEVLDVIIDLEGIDTITISEEIKLNDSTHILELETIDTITISEELKLNNGTYILDLKAIDEVTITESLLRVIKDSPPTWVYGYYCPVSDVDRKRMAFCDRSCVFA